MRDSCLFQIVVHGLLWHRGDPPTGCCSRSVIIGRSDSLAACLGSVPDLYHSTEGTMSSVSTNASSVCLDVCQYTHARMLMFVYAHSHAQASSAALIYIYIYIYINGVRNNTNNKLYLYTYI